MRIEELDYDLPPERIAQEPAQPRDAARLMVVDRATGRVDHRSVRDLPKLVTPAGPLRPGDLLVFNQTRVLPARFAGVRRYTGGGVQGLYLRSPGPGQWEVMLESRGTLKPGECIDLAPQAHLELLESQGGGGWRTRLHSVLETTELLGQIGSTPLPPYIRHARRAHHRPEVEPGDAQRYNTVFARDPGSVAAPTAGLHFTQPLLERLAELGVARAALTLHIGLGTFAPVRSEKVEDHPIHSEWVHIPPQTIAALQQARARGGRIIPVGTTSVRELESLPAEVGAAGAELPLALRDGFTTETRLFIRPDSGGFTFRFTDVLLTNFHLPRSTLLALVAALPGVGIQNLKHWYAIAIAEGYRFYSFGDAMLLV